MEYVKTSTRLAWTAFALSLGFAGSALARAPVVTRWNQTLLEAISATASGPTVSSRALAVAHTCMFDAWAAYDGHARGTEFNVELRRPKEERTAANKTAAISHAAFRAGIDLFPSERARFEKTLRELGYAPDLYNASLSAPAGIANIACGEVLDRRHADGSNQLGSLGGGSYGDYTGYRPVNTDTQVINPSRWQPLRVPTTNGGTRIQSFLTPQWGRVTTFALRPFGSYGLRKPAAYGTTEYRRQAEEILKYSADLTDTHKVIAEYWADGPNSVTPPGHWNLFAQHVAKRDGLDDDKTVRLFFALNSALMDSAIYAWWSKRQYDYVRPITAVRVLYAGKSVQAWGGFGVGTTSIPGHLWSPYQVPSAITPPFPECVSGHSTFSAAAAEVLRRFTGSDALNYTAVVLRGSSAVEPGLVPARDTTLTWQTFSQAADEAGLSRRYGGIHFSYGDLEGRRIGRRIGQEAWVKASSYFGP